MLRRHRHRHRHQRRRYVVAGAATHDQPPPLPESPCRSPAPSWLLSAARTLATGAGKIFNVFRSDDTSDYSNSDGGNLADDSGSDDVEDGAMFTCTDGKENMLLASSKACSTSKPYSLGIEECILKECSFVKDSLGTKELIERLIQQETFLREECARLIKIIESRVSDFPDAKDFCRPGAFDETCASESGITLPPSAIWSRTPDIAVLGVKKRVQGKSVEKGDLSEGDTLVDVAKSFMSSRPPRASPSLFNHGYGSPPCSGLHYSSDKVPLASLNQNITYSKLLKRHAFQTGSENVADGFRQVCPKLVEDTAEPQALSQSDNISIVQEEGARIISDDDMRIVIEGNSLVAARQEGIFGEKSLFKLHENGVIGNENGVALGRNMLEPIHIEENVSNLAGVLDKSEGILGAKTDKDDGEVESLQNSSFHDVVEHHNGEVSADKSHDLVVMPVKDVEVSLPRLAAESVPTLAELVNDISHAVSSSHFHSVSAVSNTKGRCDVLSVAPVSLVSETVGPNVQTKKRKAAKVSIQSRRYVTRRTTIAGCGRVWK